MFPAEPLFDDEIFVELGSFTPDFFVFFFFFCCPEKFLVAHLNTGNFFCKTVHLKCCLTVFQIRLCHDNCVLHQNSGIFSSLFSQVYAGIFNDIQRYWGIVTHIEPLLMHSEAYSAPCVTLAFIFTTLPYSELWYIKNRGLI